LKTFTFKFQSVLKLRQYRRDLCRQVLAQVLADDAALVTERARHEKNRNVQLEELRKIGAGGGVDVDRSSARRYFCGQLTTAMKIVDQRRAIVAQQISMCRAAVVRADQEVKSLEKIEENQRADFNYQTERTTARELEETWLAAHSMEFAK
jgi:flagellar protein FliJ